MRISGERPVASDSARSASSRRRRRCASIETFFSTVSGSALTRALRMVSSSWMNSARARATPSTRIRTPSGARASWRMSATVPTFFRSLGDSLLGVARLQQQEHHPVAGERLVHGLDRLWACDRERRGRQRQHHRVAHGHDRQFRWQRGDVWYRGVRHGYERRRRRSGPRWWQCTPIGRSAVRGQGSGASALGLRRPKAWRGARRRVPGREPEPRVPDTQVPNPAQYTPGIILHLTFARYAP